MSKILKNNTVFDVEIADTGVTVPASGEYTIPPQDYSTFAASSNVISFLADSTLILNDGGDDITVLSRAVDIIKGFPPQLTSPFFFDTSNIPVGISTTQEETTGAGRAPTARQTSDSPVGVWGSMVLAFKNAIGNLTLPQLDAAGRLPVTFEGFSGFSKSAVGELAAGSATMVDITGAEIILDNSKTYGSIRANLSCSRDVLFNIVSMDNGTPTIIGRIRLNKESTFEWIAGSQLVTTGASGPQSLKVQGQNPNTLSSMSAEISSVEVG